MSRDVLFIVEGAVDEPAFFSKMFSICFPDAFAFYTYKTNVHVLATRLEMDYPDFDDGSVDILRMLRSYETDDQQKNILNHSYTDIFMVFDFEPHEVRSNFATIRRMIQYFNESTDQGKMFINYPMMQSYKHFNRLPDPSFCTLSVDVNECWNYKERVGKVSKYSDLTKYDYQTLIALTVHHLRKANFVICGRYEAPSELAFLKWSGLEIYDRQYEHFVQHSEIYVLNTSIFILIDFKPTAFFSYISIHRSELLI